MVRRRLDYSSSSSICTDMVSLVCTIDMILSHGLASAHLSADRSNTVYALRSSVSGRFPNAAIEEGWLAAPNKAICMG